MGPIIKAELFFCQSKANFDEKILFGEITHHLDPAIRKMPVRGILGTRIPHSILACNLLAIEIKFYI